MIISQAVLDALRTTFSLQFWKAYEQTEPWWSRVATEVPSNSKSTTYGWIAQSMVLREWLGPRLAMNLSEHDYVLKNKRFEGTIEVDRDDIEDDNLGMYTTLTIPQLAEALKKHDDQLLTALLLANPVSFDGQPLFATGHPTYDPAGDTYANSYTSKALTPANFNYVRASMAGLKGENGQPLLVRPSLLIVPPMLEFAARAIVESTTIASQVAGAITNVAGSENVGGVAVSNVMKGWCEVLVIPELAGNDTTWYLADTTKPIKPFVKQLRRAPQFVSRVASDDPKVFDYAKYTYGVDYRGAVGMSLPFLIARAVA